MWRAAVHLQVKVEGSFQKEAHLPCICWVLSISKNSRKEWDTGSNTFACHFCVMTAGLKVQAGDFRLTLKQVKHMNCVCAPWLTAVAAEGWSVKWRVSCLVLGFSFLFYSGSNAAWKKQNKLGAKKMLFNHGWWPKSSLSAGYREGSCTCLSTTPSFHDSSQQVALPGLPAWWCISSDLSEPPLPRPTDLTIQ